MFHRNFSDKGELEAFREENFRLELQEISSFFGSDLDKFNLGIQKLKNKL